MTGTVTTKAEITVDGIAYRVLGARIRQALFEPGFAICDATNVADPSDPTAHPGAPDPGMLIGKAAELVVRRSDDSVSRSFVGKVVEAARATDKDGRPSIRLRIAPRLWRLGKRADCRIFQEMSVPDIVKKVLGEAGIPEADQDWKLTGDYPKRTYTVQYRETDLELAMRLLSEEGIYFVTTFQDGKDRVAFGDDPRGLGDIDGATSISFIETFGFGTSAEHVMWVRQAHEVRSDKVFVRDYDFERPKLKLEAEVEGEDEGAHALEVYVYPGRFQDEGVAKRYAQVLLDSMQAERDVVTGETTVLTMQPGRRFSITDHPYEPLNQEYLIVGLDIEARELRSPHAAGGAGGRDYVCRFEAIPTARSSYRPPRLPRARTAAGLQTAFTTGPSGAEIHTDKHGRVKAKFHWDRLGKDDDTSSTWMRTSQVPTGGSMLLPRVGWEVAIRYLEGDVDRPVVMSRLYNAVAPPPYALPGGKARGAIQTATTPGGGSANELRTDDTKGKEEMFLNASRDMSIDVVNNTTEKIGNNETREVGSNHVLHVTNSLSHNVGGSQSVSVGGNQTVHVETFKVDQIGGDHTHTIGGNRTMMIGGDHRREVGGSAKLDVGSMDVNVVVGAVSETTTANMTHDVGAALVEMTAGDRSVIAGGARAESTGLAKVVVAGGGRGVEVGGTMMQKVAGAIVSSIKGDRADQVGATLTEVAAGAQIVKADNVVLEADGMLTLVMGASTLVLTPASIMLMGVSVKLDGATAETAALIVDN